MSSRADGRSNDPYVLLIATISCTQHLSYSSLRLLVYFWWRGAEARISFPCCVLVYGGDQRPPLHFRLVGILSFGQTFLDHSFSRYPDESFIRSAKTNSVIQSNVIRFSIIQSNVILISDYPFIVWRVSYLQDQTHECVFLVVGILVSFYPYFVRYGKYFSMGIIFQFGWF